MEDLPDSEYKKQCLMDSKIFPGMQQEMCAEFSGYKNPS
jgi:hypothetical protein